MAPRVALALAAVRVASIAISSTMFVPDEYFQCTEVAHRIVFGSGVLTWEWQHGLRSFVHPLLFALPLALLSALGLDSPQAVIVAPRVMQALLTAVGDWAVVELAVRSFGRGIRTRAMIVVATNWFLLFTGARTLANSLEYTLVAATLLALDAIEREDGARHAMQARLTALHAAVVLLACVAAYLRVTSAMLLAVPLVRALALGRQHARTWIVAGVAVGVPTLCVLVAADSALYGRLVVPPWAFVSFNVLQGGAAHFGVHPWHWYLSQGVWAVAPTELAVVPIVALLAGWRALPAPSPLLRGALVSAALSLVAYSTQPHKEFRFLMGALPAVLAYAAGAHEALVRVAARRRMPALRYALAVLALAQIGVAAFVGTLHQGGVMHALVAVRNGDHGAVRGGVIFLTPCFSSPAHAWFHRDGVQLRMLGCTPPAIEPPAPSLHALAGEDEADVFFRDPVRFVARDGAVDLGSFSHVIMFEDVERALRSELLAHGFVASGSYFHTWFVGDTRATRNAVVWSRRAAA